MRLIPWFLNSAAVEGWFLSLKKRCIELVEMLN